MRAFFDGLLDQDFQAFTDVQILGVYLALYDSLVDDDEDVRDQGAKLASTIISKNMATDGVNDTATLSLSPPAARKRLLRFLYDSYATSKKLSVESVRRLTGMDSAPDFISADVQGDKIESKQGKSVLRLRPVADLSLEARTTSTVVFVEERQNLYIDTVSEAVNWAELLLRLDPDTWPSRLASDLEIWSVEGLEHITEILQEGVDGAPNLTSKPEVFTLFTRVLQAAKVVIMRRGIHPSPEKIGKEYMCVGLLEKLLDLGRSRQLHDLLLYRIEIILQEISQSPHSKSRVAAEVESDA